LFFYAAFLEEVLLEPFYQPYYERIAFQRAVGAVLWDEGNLAGSHVCFSRVCYSAAKVRKTFHTSKQLGKKRELTRLFI